MRILSDILRLWNIYKTPYKLGLWVNIFFSFMYLALFMPLASATTLNPENTLKIEDYLKYRVESHPAFMAGTHKNEETRMRLEAAQETFSVDLRVKPYYNREIGSRVFRNSYNTLFRQDGSIYQSRVTSSVQLSSNNASRFYLENDQPLDYDYEGQVNFISNSYSFGVEQALHQNGFGRLSDLNIDLLRQELKANELSLRIAKLDICTEASQKYLSAFSLQEKIALFQTKLEVSKELLRRTKSEFRQKLISQSDVYQVELEQNAIEYALEDLNRVYREQLTASAWSQAEFITVDPSLYFQNLEFELRKVAVSHTKTPLRAENYVASVQLSEVELALAQEKNKSKFDLFAEASRIKGEQNKQSDYQQDVYTIGFNWQIPIYGGSTKAEERIALTKAHNDVVLSQLQLEELEKNYPALMQQVSAYEKQQNILVKGVDLAKAQLKLASTHLKNYRISYAEYRRIREELTAKELQLLDYQESKWREFIKLASLLLDESSLCG